MPSLVDAVLLRRAEEQMKGAWARPTPAEAREETKKGPKTCGVTGCYRVIPKADKHRVCRNCRRLGLVLSPCTGCGGPLRRTDLFHVAESRKGYCQRCRGEMPVPPSPARWRPGQSGGGHKVRKPRTPEQRARESAQELARYHRKVKLARICCTPNMEAA